MPPKDFTIRELNQENIERVIYNVTRITKRTTLSQILHTILAYSDVEWPDLNGDCAYFHPSNYRIIYIPGLIAPFIYALHQLLWDHSVYMWPSSRAEYAKHGIEVRYPVVTRIPEEGYNSIHWCPISLRTIPYIRPMREDPYCLYTEYGYIYDPCQPLPYTTISDQLAMPQRI